LIINFNTLLEAVKKLFFLFFIATVKCYAAYGQAVHQLPLLLPDSNFKVEILDRLIKEPTDTGTILMVRIEHNAPMIGQKGIDPDDEIWITALRANDFSMFKFIKDKYIGYFEYKGHIALVYGNTNGEDFFSKLGLSKEFPFLSLKPYDEPVSFEPTAFVYKFHFKKLTYTYMARGFYN